MTTVPLLWVGLLVLAASRLAIWKATRLSFDNLSNDGTYVRINIMYTPCLICLQGHHGMGTLYEYQWPMDSEQDSTRVLRRPYRIFV